MRLCSMFCMFNLNHSLNFSLSPECILLLCSILISWAFVCGLSITSSLEQKVYVFCYIYLLISCNPIDLVVI